MHVDHSIPLRMQKMAIIIIRYSLIWSNLDATREEYALSRDPLVLSSVLAVLRLLQPVSVTISVSTDVLCAFA